MKNILEPLFPLSYSLGIPLVAKPNAGAPKNDGSHEHLPPEVFAEIGAEMLKSGIAILGGCCGTDAGVIGALHQMRKAFTENLSVPETIETKTIAATARISVTIDVNDLPRRSVRSRNLQASLRASARCIFCRITRWVWTNMRGLAENICSPNLNLLPRNI